jgi:threonylcarbamoyladenosine tRNA methylthiotransferase MtaB
MDRLLREAVGGGLALAERPDRAHVCVVNTCAVTAEAERKSRQAIRRLATANPRASIVATGCYVTLKPQEASTLPGVSEVVNNESKPDLLRRLGWVPDGAGGPSWRLPGGRTRAFLEVQTGCDHRCAYCITALARGPASSRPAATLIEELQALEQAGYQEVVLTGVCLGSYRWPHADQSDATPSERWSLAQLLPAILDRTSIPRIRLSSVEPWDVTPELIALWEDTRLCRQLHLPLQSGAGAALRRMGRPMDPSTFRNLVERLDSAIPDLAVTTDVMVGFPGESESEFQESRRLIDELSLARIHLFRFSARPGTRAAVMPERVPVRTVADRLAVIRELANQKQQLFRQRFVGRTMSVLWESRAQGNLWRGYTDNYMPVHADHPADLRNTVTPVRLTGFRGDALTGEVLAIERR